MDRWTWPFLLADAASCLGAMSIVVKLLRHRHESIRSSTVFWILVFLFLHLALWTLFRVLFFAMLLLDASLTTTESSDTLSGIEVLTQWPSIVVMIVGDCALVGTSLWFLAMTHELYRLAKTAMDRGVQRERVVTRRYTVAVHCLVAVFGLMEVLLTIQQQEYRVDGLYITITGISIQLLGLFYVFIVYVRLKCSGKSVESVHGEWSPSPLYLRIRNLLIVFALFSLQYQIIALIFVRHKLHKVSSLVVNLSTLLFRLIGVPLAFVMGCSQEWVVRTFRRLLPPEYVENHLSAPFTQSCQVDDEGIDVLPLKDPVFVFTDIESSSALWAVENGRIMAPANELHDCILRAMLVKYRGYEIATAGDSFQLAFRCIRDAVEYCMEVQLKLLQAKWPKELHACGIASVKRERIEGRLVFEGLRVRMGIHDACESLEGDLVRSVHSVTGKSTFTGLSEVIASKVGEVGHGGQILMTTRVAQWVKDHARNSTLSHHCAVRFVNSFYLTSVKEPMQVYELVMQDLEARVVFFGHAPLRRVSSCVQIVIEEHDEYSTEDSGW